MEELDAVLAEFGINATQDGTNGKLKYFPFSNKLQPCP
jgi:hypothetical protein